MSKVVKIDTNFFKGYKNMPQLRKLVKNHVKGNFVGIIVRNRSTHFLIEFNGSTARKISTSCTKKTLLCTPFLKEIIIEGTLKNVDVVDKRGRKEVIAIYHFETIVQIEDKEQVYYFNVRQLKTGKFMYWGFTKR